MPLVSRTFDQLIDFTRTSSATFVNESGNIASTPQSRNLLTFTNEFANAAWTKTNATIVPNVNPAAASLGSELVTNGDFASGTTGWSAANSATLSNSSNRLSVVNGATALGQARSTITTVPGRIYRVAATFTSVAGSRGSVFVGTFAGDNSLFSDSPITASRSVTGYFVATGTTTHIAVGVADNTLALEVLFDDISVREVSGGALQAPDGTFTADTLVANAGTSLTPRVADTSNPTTINAAAYTASMYVKAGTYTFFQIYINNQSSEWANFTLTGAGTASANGSCTATITALSGGWYRCTMSYTAGGTDRRPFFMMAASGSATRAQTWNPAGTETIFLWGAQLEQASAATDYTRNFGGLFPPRFDYDPVTRAPRGLLIEEQRTNLLVRSEDFSTSWSGPTSTGTVTAAATTSPDGTVDATLFVPSTSAVNHDLTQTVTASAVTYTLSVYGKAQSYSHLFLLYFDGTTDRVAYFNLSNGTIGTTGGSPGAVITAAGNGWYRCSITFTGVVGRNNFVVGGAPSDGGRAVAGNGTSGIFIWGAQLEAGAFATSYIPTVASQVTRTADVAGINAPNFASWFNATAGTLLVEASVVAINQANNPGLASLDDNTTNNRVLMFQSGSVVDSRVVFSGTQFTTANATSVSANTPFKAALAFAAGSNQGIMVVNGNLGTASSPTGAFAPNRLAIGGGVSLGATNGHIRSIRFYPVRLTNAQLQALTA